jgi:hypothetical protein
MSETSNASRQVMLLVLVTGLFVAVWSGDSGHRDEESVASPSAIAILMQTTAAERTDDPAVDEDSWTCQSVTTPPMAHAQFAAALLAGTPECEFDYPERYMTDDLPVEAPLPVECQQTSTTIDEPIIAPIPLVADLPVEAPTPVVQYDNEPVVAPVPGQWDTPLVGTNSELPVLNVAARRVKMDYRMSCECCREYCGMAARKVAALQRQAAQAWNDLSATVARTVKDIDWKTRLSSKPTDESQRRY